MSYYHKKSSVSLFIARKASWLLHPTPPFFIPPPPLVCVVVPFPLRHGAGQPLRSEDVLRSQDPGPFPPIQKQISGLPCWDQVYVLVSLSANMCGVMTMELGNFSP